MPEHVSDPSRSAINRILCQFRVTYDRDGGFLILGKDKFLEKIGEAVRAPDVDMLFSVWVGNLHSEALNAVNTNICEV